MRLFDTHAHIDDSRFADDLDSLMQRSRDAGIVGTMSIGTTEDASRRCVEIANRYEDVYAAVGIQPTYVEKPESGDWDQIVELAGSPQVKAIGETGVDCYWEDNAPVRQQQEWFERHIELSRQLDKPFVVHMRDSGGEILDTLKSFRSQPLSGVMHSFTGDWDLAKVCLDYGMHISFAGMVTFKNAADLRDVALKVPIDRLLIETDAPYLTPHPHRGVRPNEPHYVAHTARCLAELRGMEIKAFAEQTTENAIRFLKID